ncbi:PRD domain-containing protein [Enterococcus rivorum]|uniref:Transcriptional antiterminator n=1 Tax=Enterococcus rivorum TaxID=762845 RepID=A0A1E5L1J6_9ENTE|nr:PRD domain-containing protein [Enterococcus rivorum]MBP2098742.1 PRD domain protein (TIGR03582 family) [Enterococcus rivorum]OEH83933.1 transcriptional antiterminator [Enterococcus rivorum]
MKLHEEAEKIITESSNQSDLKELINKVAVLLEEQTICPTELQWTILINHLNEMIKRSKAGEQMSGVDPEMFAEVSEEALKISNEVVQHIGNLPQDEMYVLSIHFETAKQNAAV